MMGGGSPPPPQIIYPPPAPAHAPTTQVPTQALASQSALNEVSGKQLIYLLQQQPAHDGYPDQ